MKIIIDTREQTPWTFPRNVETIRATVQVGDYTVEGYEDRIAVERKSLNDLVGCLFQDRARFERNQLDKLRGITYRAVIIEGNMYAVTSGSYYSKWPPHKVLQAMTCLMCQYKVPFLFADNAVHAPKLALAFMRSAKGQLQLKGR